MMQRNRWWIKVLNVPVMERSAECRCSAENRPDWRVPDGRSGLETRVGGFFTRNRATVRERGRGDTDGGTRMKGHGRGTRTNPSTLDVAEGELGSLSEFGWGSARKLDRRLSVGGRRGTIGPTPPPLRFGWNRVGRGGWEGYSKLGKFYVVREVNVTVRRRNNICKLFLLEVTKINRRPAA